MKTSIVISDGTFPCDTAPLQGPLEVVAREAAALGFDALQLTVNRPEELNPASIKAEIEKYGLSISGFATGRGYSVDGLSLSSDREEIRKEAVERMKRHMDTAALLDHAQVVIGSIRGVVSECSSPERFEENLSLSLQELLSYAAERQVPLTLEVIHQPEKFYFKKTADTAAFIRGFGSPYLHLHLGTMQLLCEENPFQAVRDGRDVLSQIDISDAGRHCPDGKHFDYPGLVRTLKEISYDGLLVFEYQPEEGGAERGLKYITGLLG